MSLGQERMRPNLCSDMEKTKVKAYARRYSTDGLCQNESKPSEQAKACSEGNPDKTVPKVQALDSALSDFVGTLFITLYSHLDYREEILLRISKFFNFDVLQKYSDESVSV